MLIHLWHLLIRAFSAIPVSLGSTWLGIIFPIAGGFGTEIVKTRAWSRKKWPHLRDWWRRGLRHTFLFALAWWVILFSGCVVKVIYQDHGYLVNRNDALVSENGELRAELTREQKRPVGLAQRTDLLNPTFNSTDGTRVKELIVVTDKNVSPVEGRLTCGHPILNVDERIAGMRGQMRSSGYGRFDQPNVYVIPTIVSPEWTPTMPLVFEIRFKSDSDPNLTPCNFSTQ